MTKFATKTVFSVALMAAAFSVVGCSMEYHDKRDANMKLSTPPMVETPASTISGSMQGKDMVVVPAAEVAAPLPMFIQRTTPVTPGEVQMIDQPGTVPAVMSPTVEAMPDLQPMVYDGSYPRSR